MSIKLLRITCFLALISILSLFCEVSASTKNTDSTEVSSLRNTDQQKPNNFSVLACVTWWSHDAVGYHPAMSLFLENTSGHAILGGEIPFQGRFTDIRTGDVTVAREYRRAPIRDHERISIFLRGPKYYELPIESSLWPTIECKAMCRLSSNVVEDLFFGHLARVTMSDDEAHAHLVAQAGRSPLLMKQKNGKLANVELEEVYDSKQDKNPGPPLRATPNTISGAHAKSKSTTSASKKLTPHSYPKYIPGVGSDFYAFDKLYGSAAEVQPGSGGEDLTWAHYQNKDQTLVKDIFVGSRNANKADVIIIVLEGSAKEKQLMPLAKQLANCKTATMTPFVHSVKYLPNGRFEFMSTAMRDNRILSFEINDGATRSTVLIVSRLPGDPETAVSNYSKRVNFLNFLGL